MVAGLAKRDSRALIAVLVALIVLAFAAVVDLGEMVNAMVLLGVLAVFITAVAVWRGRGLTGVWRGRGLTGGRGTPSEAR